MRTPDHFRQTIALIGLSGTGKSSVGRRLAEQLGWPLRDTDALIASQAGCTIAELFAAQGEACFRDLEAAALKLALADPQCVLSTGAGLVLRPENRALLREHALIAWLDAPTEALVARLQQHDEARPLLLGGDAAARIEALRQARAAIYAELADLRIETHNQTVQDIADTILDAFRLKHLIKTNPDLKELC